MGFIGSTCTALPSATNVMAVTMLLSPSAHPNSVATCSQGLTLVHVRAQLELILDSFIGQVG